MVLDSIGGQIARESHNILGGGKVCSSLLQTMAKVNPVCERKKMKRGKEGK